MNYNERNEIFLTEDFIGRVRIALCDWLNYWAINGTTSIENETLRELTNTFVTTAIFNLEAMVKRISVLVIAEPSVKNAVEITDTDIQTAITNILSHALNFLL